MKFYLVNENEKCSKILLGKWEMCQNFRKLWNILTMTSVSRCDRSKYNFEHWLLISTIKVSI